MSVETLGIMGAGQVLAKRANDNLATLLAELNINIKRQTDAMPRFRTFLKSAGANLSSNVADGVIILLGQPVPRGNVGVVTDISINFTTAAGTVRISVIAAP